MDPAVSSLPCTMMFMRAAELTPTAAELVYGTVMTCALNRLPSAPLLLCSEALCTTPAVTAPESVARWVRAAPSWTAKVPAFVTSPPPPPPPITCSAPSELTRSWVDSPSAGVRGQACHCGGQACQPPRRPHQRPYCRPSQGRGVCARHDAKNVSERCGDRHIQTAQNNSHAHVVKLAAHGVESRSEPSRGVRWRTSLWVV